MSKHLVWEPIFKDEANHTDGIVKVRFIVYTDPTKPQIDFLMETGRKFADFQHAVDKIVEIYGNDFSTMIDTGALTLAETVQCSTDGIRDGDEWRAHLEYLKNWRDTQ